MLAPGRPHPGRILLFLGTVAVFYLLLWVALLLGASTLLDTLQETENSRPLRVAQLVVGIGLMALGVLMEPWTKAGKERRRARRAEKLARSGPSLQMRMRQRATDASAPVGAVIIEAASMMPYLAAIGFLTTSELSLAGRVAVLSGYCLVMIAPALLLLSARLFAARSRCAHLEKVGGVSVPQCKRGDGLGDISGRHVYGRRKRGRARWALRYRREKSGRVFPAFEWSVRSWRTAHRPTGTKSAG